MPEADLPAVVPGTVRAAAALVAVQGAALVALGVAEALTPVLGETVDAGVALVTAAFATLGGVLVLLLARALSRLRKAARSPAVVVQLISLPVGVNLIGPSGQPAFGVPLLAIAIGVLALLSTASARAVLARGDE